MSNVEFYAEYYQRLSPSNFTVEIADKDRITVYLGEPKKRQNVLMHYIGSLTNYAIDRGLNITPLPELQFIEDTENANQFFGRTAYYDPDAKIVALFITQRHDKDIVRSFAHELIHHVQNIQGRLVPFDTTDIHEDDYLAEIEKEAYLEGNLLFRGWENSQSK